MTNICNINARDGNNPIIFVCVLQTSFTPLIIGIDLSIGKRWPSPCVAGKLVALVCSVVTLAVEMSVLQLSFIQYGRL